jgi:hypothetical protein
VIAAVKKQYYTKIISNSDNEMKCTWKIINKEKGISKQDIGVLVLMRLRKSLNY